MPYPLGRTAKRGLTSDGLSGTLPGARQREKTHTADVTVPAWLRGDAVRRYPRMLLHSQGGGPGLYASPA